MSETMSAGEIAFAINTMRAGWDRCEAIRAFYDAVEPAIIDRPANEWGIDPYMVDWTRIFTPIEFGLWHDIRVAGAVLYPQYPIGRYFADFANPVAGVVIECDGEKWHQDSAKDKARQSQIEALGWTVYRIGGRQCLEPDQDDDGQPNPDRAALFLKDIVQRHGL